ncbi:serine hydrolase domain-containing protein [Mucilaginibacter sabulilitoris]|uniref:Serine hydrolase domain-containing protein n=1 Tax=Mucilaginibacter sabulilitoris TaxID=1173583 RepID=A0ABZ0TGE2_9SPHI|nr:serine hydrolase domain-containing protein [Mucilaginibacter sabulilitoris]WPU92022.1 serine hydrolase domain-containing protein [Mucilaginibacter sabulilitoris]
MAQNISGKLDSLFIDLVKNNEFNGNVLAAENARVIYQRSFGYADAEHQLPNTRQTTFNLASVSKIFTAVAILQLKQKGKLSFDDPYVKYFPDFPWPAITIRQLLSHTSGLPDNQIFEKPYQENPNKIYDLNDLIPAFKNDKRGLLFKPGEKFGYSNTGFGLLALLVEKRSGLKFQDYLKKYIFRPAGMVHTYIETPLVPVADPGRAVRYEFLSYEPDRLKRVDSVKKDRIQAVILGAILGPDCVVSTTHDLLKFDQALYGNKLLKPQILQQAFEPAVLNNGEKAIMGWANTNSYYGLGWMILCDSTYGKVVWHSGGDPGEVTVFLRNITRKQTVIVLDNVTHRSLHPQGVNAYYLLNDGPVLTFKKSLTRAYADRLVKKGADAAAVLFNEFKTDTAHYYPMNEKELNAICYDMLDDGYKTEALEALKLNTFLFPDSWNAYDSYGEALARAGKKEEAMMMYKKSIAINPGNTGGKNALKRLEIK